MKALEVERAEHEELHLKVYVPRALLDDRTIEPQDLAQLATQSAASEVERAIRERRGKVGPFGRQE